MTEQRRMQYAKRYMELMAKGINPLTKEPVSEQDLVRDPHIANCLNYVAGILGAVLENGGTADQETIITEKRPKRPRFFITEEQRKNLVPADRLLYISDIARYLNEVTEKNGCKGISATRMNNWLLSIGILEPYDLGRKSLSKRATELGKSIGIISSIYHDTNGLPSYRNQYSPEAQQFIFDNLDALLQFLKS